MKLVLVRFFLSSPIYLFIYLFLLLRLYKAQKSDPLRRGHEQNKGLAVSKISSVLNLGDFSSSLRKNEKARVSVIFHEILSGRFLLKHRP